MKKLNVIILVILVAIFAACSTSKKKSCCSNGNPFFKEYNTPFKVPDFDKIKDSHFLPALIEGMKRQKDEIEKIVNNQESPTFENTILPYDKSGKFYGRVATVFYSIRSANTNDSIKSILKKLSLLSSKHKDDISLNHKLFVRIKTIYDKRNKSKLDTQQIRVVEKLYNFFVRHGANFSDSEKDTLRMINQEMSIISLNLESNILEETNNNFKLIIEDKSDLDGLPEGIIRRASEIAKSFNMYGKWVFTTLKSSMIPFLTYANNRNLRELLYQNYLMRGNNDNCNDNKTLFNKLVNLRVKKAKLMGYNNYAEYSIAKNMAKTPENVNDFLMKLWKPSLRVAKKELKEMQQIIDKEGGNFKLASWDWWYYSEKVKKKKFNFDENEMRPYFKLSNVRDGTFHVANKLYGITFHKRTDIPVYQKDVEVFEVKEKDGTHLGIMYYDYYSRRSKKDGSWCGSFRRSGWENNKKVNPIITIVCNFTKPTRDTPTLLSWDEVLSLYHEFGQGLLRLFEEGKYSQISGRVAIDYMGLSSQTFENYADEPEVLKFYAKHYKTEKVIPISLIKKMQKSVTFNQGFITTEYLAAAILDMQWETVTEEKDRDVLAFEKAVMDKIGLIKEISPRYRTTYFNHIFIEKYAAGYYTYIWSSVLAADAFNAFKQSGDIYNPKIATKFRKYCLAECLHDDDMVQYLKFRGQEPSIEPLLCKRGLK